ncbi:S24 family peptidase [Roseovarius sp. MBR-6]|uniref:LexA family transcriptional regulator n=1 Tax=Roseovarius sp. MBR-6 TaxID=3156459 RepID=UPI0033936A69
MHTDPSYVLLEEIKARLERDGLSHRGLENRLGLRRNFLKGILDKETRTPSVDNAKKIAEALGLEFYLGPPRETGPVYDVSLDGSEYAAIRRIDARLAAGAGAVNDQVEHSDALAFRRDWLRERAISPDQACLLTVTGDSMAPTLHDGDLVMIDRRRREVRNRRVYALIDTDGHSRVKRLDLIPDQLLILTSDNPAHPAETRQGDDMNRLNILGEIVWSAHSW